jgi:hypothetical protein
VYRLVIHRATSRFWKTYRELPEEVRIAADAAFVQLKKDPRHPSLHFKKLGELWSVRVGLRYRALASEEGSDMVWLWIGPHAEYDRVVKFR